MIKKSEISGYLRRVGKGFPFGLRRKLLADLKSSLSDYLEENPESSMEDVIAHFGAPEKFADEYIAALDVETRQRLFRKSRWIKGAILIAAIVIVLLFVVTYIWMIRKNARIAAAYHTEGVIDYGITVS